MDRSESFLKQLRNFQSKPQRSVKDVLKAKYELWKVFFVFLIILFHHLVEFSFAFNKRLT